MREKLKEIKAQMTIELALVFPILIVIASVMVNALSFASECSRFDRIARNALRCETATPAIEENSSQALERVQDALTSNFLFENETVLTSVNGSSGSSVVYECELKWSPTLFGMGLKSEIFGIRMFELSHKTTLVVDPHRSGDIA